MSPASPEFRPGWLRGCEPSSLKSLGSRVSENSAGFKKRLLLGGDRFLDKPHSLAATKFTWNSWVLLIGKFTELYTSGVQSLSIHCYFLFALIGNKGLIWE